MKPVSMVKRRDFRYKFSLKHYSIRSVPQGRNKLTSVSRRPLGRSMRKKSGWHVHYQSIISRNSSLIWPIEELHEFSSKRFREEYGVVVATTLAHFVSPLANGRRMEPETWNDPHEREVLNKTLDDTRVLNRAHKNKMTAEILKSVRRTKRPI